VPAAPAGRVFDTDTRHHSPELGTAPPPALPSRASARHEERTPANTLPTRCGTPSSSRMPAGRTAVPTGSSCRHSRGRCGRTAGTASDNQGERDYGKGQSAAGGRHEDSSTGAAGRTTPVPANQQDQVLSANDPASQQFLTITPATHPERPNSGPKSSDRRQAP
jgi:hypothetical protein